MDVLLAGLPIVSVQREAKKKSYYMINFPAKNNQIILMNLFVCEPMLPGPNLRSMNLSRISFMIAFMLLLPKISIG